MHQRQHQPSLTAVDMGTTAHYKLITLAKVHVIKQPVVLKVHCTIGSIASISYYLCLYICISLSQVSDWAVDYGVPGGTDKEGWQYAADFHVYVDFECTVLIEQYLETFVSQTNVLCSYRTFHGYKTMKDFVRRRRWARLVYSIAAFELTDSFIHVFTRLFVSRNIVSV